MKQVFLNAHSLEESLNLLFRRLDLSIYSQFETETVKVQKSLGRVTTSPVFARYSSPFYHSAAMDGYAVRFSDTCAASERNPIHLKLNIDAVYVDTGDPLPDGFNAVIMIEDINLDGDFIEIYSAVTPYQHVRTIGEDIVATELIIPQNHRIRAIDIGAMLASGILDIKVRKKPVVSIIPTGSELIEPEDIRNRPPMPPEIIEYNSAMLSGLVEETGAESIRFDIVKDDIEAIMKSIKDAILISDIVIINAGSGRGSEDFTLAALKNLGEVLVSSVSIKPGKPLIVGFIEGKPVFGIPGYPVSAFLTFELFVKPVIARLLGAPVKEHEFTQASISRQVSSQLGVDEYIRVKVGVVDGNYIATPVGRGAGLLMSIVRADGIINVPSSSEGYASGSKVNVELFRGIDEIKKTIVCIGSHDNTLDILANILKRNYPELSLSSAHVGSMGGLMAIKKSEAHIAGTHLLDENTGEYNVTFIKRLFPEGSISLITLVYRQQGLLVKTGNPKRILNFRDLTRDDIVFINRQGGSGTRLLLDKHLKDIGVSPQEIRGYQKEEYTHMAVASAVLSGIADVGLGIYSSAKALGLDFIPVANERYDLAIPLKYMETDLIKKLLNIIRFDKEFREAVLSLGGYDANDMGKVVFP